jgi:glyoxylase-like metal-dependent hydrolase (beta-lactamase superfamily II)
LLLLVLFVNRAIADDELPELQIRQLTDNVYLHTSFQAVTGFGVVDSNGLVVTVGNDAYIIDTPWSKRDTQKLLAWIEQRGFIPRGSVSTHFHDDRTAGIALLNSKAVPTYASRLTNELLEKAGKPQAADAIASDDFWLLKNEIQVFFPGAGHAPDNVVVWLPTPKILFGGCLVRPAETTNLGNTNDAVMDAWAASIGNLQSRYGNAALVVPGHGKVGDVSMLEHTRALAAASMSAKNPAPAESAQ